MTLRFNEFGPYSDHAQRALESALEFMTRNDLSEITPNAVLSGLCKRECSAAKALKAIGVSPNDLSSYIEQIPQQPPTESSKANAGEQTKKAFEAARHRRGERAITTGDLLYHLLHETDTALNPYLSSEDIEMLTQQVSAWESLEWSAPLGPLPDLPISGWIKGDDGPIRNLAVIVFCDNIETLDSSDVRGIFMMVAGRTDIDMVIVLAIDTTDIKPHVELIARLDARVAVSKIDDIASYLNALECDSPLPISILVHNGNIVQLASPTVMGNHLEAFSDLNLVAAPLRKPRDQKRHDSNNTPAGTAIANALNNKVVGEITYIPVEFSDWKEVPPAALPRLLRRLNPMIRPIPFDPRFSTARIRELPFFDHIQLVEITNLVSRPAYNKYALIGPGYEYIVDWTVQPIYQANERGPLMLTPGNIVPYIEYFSEYVFTSDGQRFPMKSFDSLPLAPEVTESEKAIIRHQLLQTGFKPPELTGVYEDGSFRVELFDLAKFAIWRSVVFVTPNGNVDWIVVDSVIEDLPIRRRDLLV